MAKHVGNRTGREAKRRRARHERRVIHTRYWRRILARAAAMVQAHLNARAGEPNWDSVPRSAEPDDRPRVLMLRVPPNLETFWRARLNADRVVIDPAMAPDRIEVTPVAYAERIDCVIGFQNPTDTSN